MIVLGGSAAGSIGKSIAKSMRAKYSAIVLKQFPDGEFAVKVPFNAYGEDVVVVQSTYAPQEKHLMELLFMGNALKEAKAKSICAVVPYMAYMRQNRSFTEGEGVSADLVMKLLSRAGFDSLITVQPHKEEPLRFFKGKTAVVNPIRTMVKGIEDELKEPYVLAPDEGSLEIAKLAAKTLGCEYTHVDKERDPLTGAIKIKNASGERFDGRQVVIVDDMISTGGTIALSAKFAYGRGASEVVTAAVHLLMAGDASFKLAQVGVKKVYGTNTIPCDTAKLVDISADITAALKKLK